MSISSALSLCFFVIITFPYFSDWYTCFIIVISGNASPLFWCHSTRKIEESAVTPCWLNVSERKMFLDPHSLTSSDEDHECTENHSTCPLFCITCTCNSFTVTLSLLPHIERKMRNICLRNISSWILWSNTERRRESDSRLNSGHSSQRIVFQHNMRPGSVSQSTLFWSPYLFYAKGIDSWAKPSVLIILSCTCKIPCWFRSTEGNVWGLSTHSAETTIRIEHCFAVICSTENQMQGLHPEMTPGVLMITAFIRHEFSTLFWNLFQLDLFV